MGCRFFKSLVSLVSTRTRNNFCRACKMRPKVKSNLPVIIFEPSGLTFAREPHLNSMRPIVLVLWPTGPLDDQRVYWAGVWCEAAEEAQDIPKAYETLS